VRAGDRVGHGQEHGRLERVVIVGGGWSRRERADADEWPGTTRSEMMAIIWNENATGARGGQPGARQGLI
jgi:hypothetical protein